MLYYWREMKRQYDKMKKQLKIILERTTYNNKKILESDWDQDMSFVWTNIYIALWGIAAIVISLTLF